MKKMKSKTEQWVLEIFDQDEPETADILFFGSCEAALGMAQFVDALGFSSKVAVETPTERRLVYVSRKG